MLAWNLRLAFVTLYWTNYKCIQSVFCQFINYYYAVFALVQAVRGPHKLLQNTAIALSFIVLRSIPDSFQFSLQICCGPTRWQIVRLRLLRCFHFLRFPNLVMDGRILLKWILDWVHPNIPVLHIWRCFPPKIDPRIKALRYFETSEATGTASHRRHRCCEIKRLNGLMWLRLATGGGLFCSR